MEVAAVIVFIGLVCGVREFPRGKSGATCSPGHHWDTVAVHR
jgi:hypothetical protein